MLNAAGDVLYVGKAKALQRRVLSYAQIEKQPLRLQRMIAETVDMLFMHTHTEVEALLLESNLIKKLKPRYNVLLRDDKSFPYIMITGDHDFPLLTKHRGAHKRKGEYFGPFASAASVNHTVAILQRAFMLRNCADTVFANRSRPCLQYHIKRCTAPCATMAGVG
jgi:excinuclease ABC subunit C